MPQASSTGAAGCTCSRVRQEPASRTCSHRLERHARSRSRSASRPRRRRGAHRVPSCAAPSVCSTVEGLPQRGIRKSKTGRWRGAALILLNLLMIAHIIQWWIMGKTVSPIEPSETMHTLQKRGDQRRVYLFYPGDPGDVDLRTFCLRLGLSHSRPPGFLRVALEENGPHAEAVSIEAPGLCSVDRSALHVCLAHRLSPLCATSIRTAYPGIHQPSGHQ